MRDIDVKIGLAFEDLSEEEMLMYGGGQDEKALPAISTMLTTSSLPCTAGGLVTLASMTLISVITN